LAPEHEQLGVGGVNFPEGVLKLVPGLDAPLDLLDPPGGDALDPLLAAAHEGKEPDGVAWLLSAVASGLAAAPVGERKGARQEILREVESADELELALAEAGGPGASGLRLHLYGAIHTDNQECEHWLQTVKIGGPSAASTTETLLPSVQELTRTGITCGSETADGELTSNAAPATKLAPLNTRPTLPSHKTMCMRDLQWRSRILSHFFV